MDKETEILSRLAANHLFLGQFEPLRATILALRDRSPDLALAVLQTVVARSGRFDGVLWTPSCQSPSLLTYLTALELSRYDGASSAWRFDSEALQLRAEFLLLIQHLIDRVSEDSEKSLNLDDGDTGSFGDLIRVLNRILELAVDRLKADEVENSGDGDERNWSPIQAVGFEETEFSCLRKVIWDFPDVFDALCLNIERQLSGCEGYDSSDLAITTAEKIESPAVEEGEEEDAKVLGSVQRSVQIAHLDAIRECVKESNVDGAISHIRFLHLYNGVDESEYRIVLQDLLKVVSLGGEGYGDSWHYKREKLLMIFGAALASNCRHLIQILRVLEDDLLLEKIKLYRSSDDSQIPLPLECFQKYVEELKLDSNFGDKTPLLSAAGRFCMRDMYHYARVSGKHVLESVMDTALSAVKRDQLKVASNILSVFPRLQPLVAAMGWDLLSGKTAARRKLMHLLWTSKSQVLRLEESSFYSNDSDEISCVEHLCDSLCYQLDLASFVACVNSGQSWDSKFSLMLSGKEPVSFGSDNAQLDPFVENFVLERLSVQSPLLVLFDVVPGIEFQDAIKLISMQPIASKRAGWKSKQDIELMHMRYALESVVLALKAMERNMTRETESHHQEAYCFLRDLQSHLDAITNIPRKIMMVNVIISLLHMDDLSLNLAHCGSSRSYPESSHNFPWEDTDLTSSEGGNKLVITFTGMLLEILNRNVPSSVTELQHGQNDGLTMSGRQALEWRVSIANRFIEEWEWRLSILQGLLPLTERQWRWKEALAVLRAAPSMLLNLCMQRAKYDIGEEAVNRFSLSAEDKATLELAEWVDNSVKTASLSEVEDVISRAADETSTVQDVDFSSLRSQLGPLAAILLCIDIAATSARSPKISQQLLDQAQVMLSEIYPGVSPKRGPTYWDQILEVGVISVSRRVLKRLNELLDKDNPAALQTILSGELGICSPQESHRQGQRERALAMLHQMIEDAHKEKRQFLSGKLHNLARAIADEEIEPNYLKGEGSSADQKAISDFDKKGVFGIGLRVMKQKALSSAAGVVNEQHVDFDAKDTGNRYFGPLSNKPTTYLSQFILHVAAIGDIVDGTDTTHDFNFFSLVYEWPKDLLTRLVFDRGSTDAASKVADIMCADFVHEVISACVPSVYPPRSGDGWACIPIISSSPKSGSENKVFSPSTKGVKPNHTPVMPGIPLYPLELDVVKHLIKISPVRAILACVFGSSILYSGNTSSISSSLNSEMQLAPDTKRSFFEFAVDQSERFPTLNRWIQMQTNLHRVSEFAVRANQTADGGLVEAVARSAIKRAREYDSDTESEIDENVGGSNVSKSIPASNSQVDASPDMAWHDSANLDSVEPDNIDYISFNWENEEPYEKALERLTDEGKLMDALVLSDRFLRNGASDRLLQLLIEHGEENQSISGQSQTHGVPNNWSNSWQYCLRLKDKQLAARLALKYMHWWELNAALDVLTMCSCHLSQGDSIRDEVLHMRRALQRYNHILSADNTYRTWQEVEAECKEDPEGLALRLAEKGAVSAALDVAESAGLSIELRRELQGRQLVKLLTADPLSGGGPAEASRFLSSLRDSDDALPVAMGAMQLLPNLRSKQLLVHFFLKRRAGNLSDIEVSRLNSWALGLRVLAALPVPWQQRCSSLHEYPKLILEVLLMRKQLQSASLILKEFSSLRDNDLIVSYAAKAIAVSISSPQREHRITVSGRQKQKAKVGTTVRSSLSSSLSNLQKEARRAFSWGPRNAGEKPAQKDVDRKRKNSGLVPSERVPWEAMAGIQEDPSVDGHERFSSMFIAEEWMLTGDASKDDAVRASHRYESAPDIFLFKALLSLCSDESVSAKGAIDLCVKQMKTVLQLPENASIEVIGRACHATETFVQGLLYAKSLLRKIVGGSDLLNHPERSRDVDDVSSDAGSYSVGCQSTDELSENLSQADMWLGRAELLQSLLGTGIAVSLDNIADQESSIHLRDRLIVEEQYSMAVYTCKKCKIDVFPVWNAWGHALIQMEHYTQARVKFKQALQLYKGDTGPVILDIINTIEGGPPVDVSAVRSMYEHLAKSAPTILDDSLSADSYLNVLYMPSTFPRSERSRWSQESANKNSAYSSEFEDGPRSNLDSIRYTECVNYLQEYARQHLLGFMFKHGQYDDACLLFFPKDTVPPPAQASASGMATTSSSPQRLDLLATDYGTLDDLCDLCVGYDAMPVLEEMISERMLSMDPQIEAVNQYTAAALGRICTYCETHRHFNFLYKFQVIKKDHVASGLCCIQLFMNSFSQDDAIKHLENAKTHFDDGLSARYKGDSTKVVTKSVRGKSAKEKLTEEGLVKFSARISIQVEVVRSYNDSDGPQWKYSLFGNPNDPETFRRRCKIAEMLVEKNFDLAFQVIYEFTLPAVDIYAGVAASLAERKRGGQLTEFFRNIKGTIEDEDWDQVLGAAINVYANKHKERPDRLIDMLTSSHRKVLACVVCGRLKSAFQIASRSGSVADVQYVAHQALHANALTVLDMCKQWLAQYM